MGFCGHAVKRRNVCDLRSYLRNQNDLLKKEVLMKMHVIKAGAPRTDASFDVHLVYERRRIPSEKK
ncbi:hypothetical protein K443DRAFT_676936 [Laccaria amethystina LaAM-08-1]|uniref:Uncharacterized protein n=1 Tax=Laccaria amethystina LaAM-08-1 TaxID=1095629 RepID=A0A0C9WV45_9AGAR|nr:hypothetical protein K443DRAFT_676936 [Laccaria amethystina LaAM-08-1]